MCGDLLLLREKERNRDKKQEKPKREGWMGREAGRSERLREERPRREGEST